MYEKRHLLQIAELLGVMEHINTSYMTPKDIIRVIVDRCNLDNSGVRITIQNAELDLNETDRESLIEDILTVRKQMRGYDTNLSMEDWKALQQQRDEATSTKASVYNPGVVLMWGKIQSFMGWVYLVLVCVLIVGSIVVTGQGFNALILAAFLPLSFVMVAIGHATRCFVSMELNGKETTVLLQKILDKMEAAD